jgi:hypothetical protein
MFYRKEDVNDVITCPVCREIYNDPRNLPCGEAACNNCILKLIELSNGEDFECSICSNKHDKPVGNREFFLVIPLVKLIKARAEHVYRNQNVDDLKAKLAEINSKSNKFKQHLGRGKNYFTFLPQS